MEEIKPQITPNTTLRSVPPRLSFLKRANIIPIVLIALVVVAGIFTGIVLSSRGKNAAKAKAASKASINEDTLNPEQKQSFTQTFRDSSDGVIQKNDTMDKYAQGTHRLVRPGGEDQTAFLTSSVLDLDQFIGKKVKVFGETFGSSQVGWLMDVGKVEVQ